MPRFWLIAGLLAAALLHLIAAPALALDTVRLGKAVPNSFAFGAAEVGTEAKIFEAEGLAVSISSFRGDAQMQQALAAGSLDIGLGSGPGLGFGVQGRADDRGRRHVWPAGQSCAAGADEIAGP